MINNVVSDHGLSIPQVEHIISSVLTAPLGRDLTKYLHQKIREREELEQAVSNVAMMALEVPVAGLELLKAIAATEGCNECPYRYPETKGKDPEKMVEDLGGIGYPSRNFSVCPLVKAGATDGKAIKLNCLFSLKEVRDMMEKVLGRPVRPDSDKDKQILKSIMNDLGNAVSNLGYIDSNIKELEKIVKFVPSRMFLPESLEIPEESPVYAVLNQIYYPMFTYLKKIFDKKVEMVKRK
jgi:hypothetical protein